MSFVEELKKRNVVRVGVFYLIAAWLLAQVGDLVLENFDAPAWMIRTLLIALAVGLPFVLMLAWAFELTPEGIKKEQDVDRNLPQYKVSGKRLDRVIIVTLVIALGYFVWDKFDASNQGLESPPAGGDSATESLVGGRSAAESVNQNTAAPAKPAEKSIAVLPFENFSGEESDTYFADGLADTLLHKLAQIQGLKVIARNSSFQFKGSHRDVREIGEILGVSTVLEGSVQRAGDQVRVIAQLINTADGVHIWSQSFDDRMENIFELQDRIAGEIVSNMQLELSEVDRAKVLRDGTGSVAAYDLLMLARSERDKNTLDSLTETNEETYLPISLLKKALSLDPNYALAWVYLSEAYNSLAFTTESLAEFQDYTEKSLEAAQKAITIDPLSADGHAALGAYYWRMKDVNEATRSFHKALELDPNNSGAMSGLGLALIQSDPAESYRLFNKVSELDPKSFLTWRHKSFALTALKQPDKTVEILKEATQRFPDQGVFFYDLAIIYQQDFGRPDLAAELVSRFLNHTPITLNGGLEMASYWRDVQDIGRANAWLDLVEQKFGKSDSTELARTRVLAAQADYAALAVANKRMLERQGTDGAGQFGWPLRWSALVCLSAGDFECVLQTAKEARLLYQAMVEKGGAIEIVQRLSDMLEGAALMGQGRAEEAQALLLPLLKKLSKEPLVSQDYLNPGKQYMAAEINSILGQTDAAMLELEETLSLAHGGILSKNFFGQPPENNLFFASLRGQPQFEDWLSRFIARRDELYQSMLAMEQAGEIISPATPR